MKNKPRTVGYIRVSTEEQSREGVSLEMQISKIEKYCELHDLELVEIFEDAGISGKTIRSRPGLRSILKMANKKEISAIVIYKLDRLARNTVECLEMAERFDKLHVALHSITEKLDTQSAIGKFFFTLMASLAEMERNLISERTKAGMAELKRQGYALSRFPPYGFRVEMTPSGRRKLKPDHYEQAVITRIRELYQLGFNPNRIARRLEFEGWRPRATRWKRGTIKKITDSFDEEFDED